MKYRILLKRTVLDSKRKFRRQSQIVKFQVQRNFGRCMPAAHGHHHRYYVFPVAGFNMKNFRIPDNFCNSLESTDNGGAGFRCAVRSPEYNRQALQSIGWYHMPMYGMIRTMSWFLFKSTTMPSFECRIFHFDIFFMQCQWRIIY